MIDERSYRLGPVEEHAVRASINALFQSDNPCRAISDMAKDAASPFAEPFERYMGMCLKEAGALALAGDPHLASVQLQPPGEGALARFAWEGNIPEPEKRALADVQDVVNRMVALADAIEDAALRTPSARSSSTHISFMGVDIAPCTPSHRSALVSLPRIRLNERPSLAFFCEVDWRMLDNVACVAHNVFQSCLRHNKRQSILGSWAAHGSDWDVRTRLASLLGRMELSLRFSFSFDCDMDRGIVRATFSAPPQSSLPRWAPGIPGVGISDENLAECQLEAISDRADHAWTTYLLRLTCLVAAACFGAGAHIEQVFLHAVDDGGSDVFSCAFNRHSFVRTVLAAVDDGSLVSPKVRFDPNRVLGMMAPNWFQVHEGTAACCLRTLTDGPMPEDFDLREQRKPLSEDDRLLPDSIVRLFGAKHASDFDTASYYGEGQDLIEEAKADSVDSVVSAIAQLETLVEELEGTLHPPDDDADSRPLFCPHAFARIAIPLIRDDLDVGAQAEEFLRDPQFLESGEHVPSPVRTPQPATFFRAPSALFHAHMGLSDLYQRMGDFAGAIAHADRCIALGPTAASAYYRKADILAEETLDTQAANVLISGLHCAIARSDCALLYYHLALLFWNMGRDSTAAAIQVYTTSLEGEFADRAKRIVKNLRKRASSPVIVHATPLAAAREMSRARIPIVPSDESRTLVAAATLNLANANIPLAAAPYARELARLMHNDPIIATACRSLTKGADPAPAIKE